MHSGDSACVIPPYSLSPETIAVIEEHTKAIAAELEVVGPHQRPVRGEGQPGVRDRGQPPRQPHGALRGQGHGRAAREGRRPHDGRRHARRAPRGGAAVPAVARRLRGRQGGGAAVQPLPRGRHRARPGDAQHRRGHGHRHHLRPGLRQEPARGRRRAARRRGCVFMSLADRDKAVGIEAARRFVRGRASRIAATAGTADALEAAGIPVDTRVAKVGEATGTDAVELISSGKVDLVVNSPRGRGARADGAHIRAAAAVQGIPCLTTAAAGLAAANGILDRAAHRCACARCRSTTAVRTSIVRSFPCDGRGPGRGAGPPRRGPRRRRRGRRPPPRPRAPALDRRGEGRARAVQRGGPRRRSAGCSTSGSTSSPTSRCTTSRPPWDEPHASWAGSARAT